MALSADERTLFVSETGKYRLWKVLVTAHDLDLAPLVKAGNDQARVLFDNLPGYPDNLMRGQDSRIWWAG